MNNEKDLQTKDVLTQSDIKKVEDELMSNFNSKFIEVIKPIMEHPPMRYEDVHRLKLTDKLVSLLNETTNLINTINTLRDVKID